MSEKKNMSTDLQFPLVESAPVSDDVILIAPWRIYQFHPSGLSSHLHRNKRAIVPDNEIYMVMNSNQPDPQTNGKLDQFCNMWVVTCESENSIDVLLEKMEAKFSLLQVLLVERHVFTNTIEIPMVIFVNNRSKDMESLKNSLKTVNEGGRNGKQFSFEVDYGPVVEKWALKVLKRDFICVGGRFCVTNGNSFNHVLDWNNLLSCLPCLPCGLMAGSAYRVGRKLRYLETLQIPDSDGGVMLVGANNCNGDEQRVTLNKLMNWTSELARIASIKHKEMDEAKQASQEHIYERKTNETGKAGRREEVVAPNRNTDDQSRSNGAGSQEEVNVIEAEDGGADKGLKDDGSQTKEDTNRPESVDKKDDEPTDDHEVTGDSPPIHKDAETDKYVQLHKDGTNAKSAAPAFQTEINEPERIEVIVHHDETEMNELSTEGLFMPNVDSDSIFNSDNPLDNSALLHFLAMGKITEGPKATNSTKTQKKPHKSIKTRTTISIQKAKGRKGYVRKLKGVSTESDV